MKDNRDCSINEDLGQVLGKLEWQAHGSMKTFCFTPLDQLTLKVIKDFIKAYRHEYEKRSDQ